MAGVRLEGVGRRGDDSQGATVMGERLEGIDSDEMVGGKRNVFQRSQRASAEVHPPGQHAARSVGLDQPTRLALGERRCQ